MTEKTFDALLGKALAEANVLQYQALWDNAAEPEFSPGYLRWRMKLLADPFAQAKRQSRSAWKQVLRGAACFVLAFSLTLGVAMAVSPEVREAVQSVIEALFPPKEITVAPEGLPESVPHTAQGQEPTEDTPGFAIYIDEGGYEMTEEGGIYYIRPKEVPISREDMRENNSALLEGLSAEEQETFIDNRIAELEAFYAALPPCEMEIRELDSTNAEAAANAVRAELAQTWETVTELEEDEFRIGFYASDGTAWDSPQEDHFFYPNEDQGAFHIVIRYYLEAAEGHGTRLHTMLNTFTIVKCEPPAM